MAKDPSLTSSYKAPKSAKKIVPLEFVDLGQGLLDIIEEINHEIKKSENSRL